MDIDPSNAALDMSDLEQGFHEEEHHETEPVEEAEADSPEEPALSLTAKLSSVLFVSPKPLTVTALAEATQADEEQVEAGLRTLQDVFQDMVHGFSLHKVGDVWELRTSPLAKEVIHRLIPPRSRRLSRAAAETLAVIAYRQPVQRAEIEAIRGVDALPTLKTLLDARLIRIVGREESPGHPALYGTTQTFLEKFGLEDLSQLPTPREMEQLLQEPGESEPAGSTDELQLNVQGAADEQAAEGSEAESEIAGSAEQESESSESDEQRTTVEETAAND